MVASSQCSIQINPSARTSWDPGGFEVLETDNSAREFIKSTKAHSEMKSTEWKNSFEKLFVIAYSSELFVVRAGIFWSWQRTMLLLGFYNNNWKVSRMQSPFLEAAFQEIRNIFRCLWLPVFIYSELDLVLKHIWQSGFVQSFGL